VDHYYGAGNDILHSLTSSKRQRLRIDFRPWARPEIGTKYSIKLHSVFKEPCVYWWWIHV